MDGRREGQHGRSGGRRAAARREDGVALVVAVLVAVAVVVALGLIGGRRGRAAGTGPAMRRTNGPRNGEVGAADLMDDRREERHEESPRPGGSPSGAGGPGSSGPGGPRSGKLLRAATFGPVATAVALALVVAGAVDFVNDRQDRKPAKKESAKKVAKKVGSGERAAPPRHVVAVRRSGEAVAVRDVRTGADVGVDAAAPPGMRWHQVASAGDGSYVLSAYAPGRITFYRLTLSEDGAPRKLAQIPGLMVRGVSTARSDMAVSGDGERIAYVVYGTGAGRIEIASANGADRRQWTTRAAGRISSLSWAGDTLSFVWATARGTVVRRQVRTLDTTAASADLRISKPVLMLPEGGTAAVLSGDGSTIVAGVREASALSLEEFSATTGRRTKVLWTRQADRSGELSGLTRHEGGHLLAAGTNELVYADPGEGVRGLSAEGYADVAW